MYHDLHELVRQTGPYNPNVSRTGDPNYKRRLEVLQKRFIEYE